MEISIGAAILAVYLFSSFSLIYGYFNKGLVYALSEQSNNTNNEAITYFDNALAIDPNDIKSLNNKGVSLAYLGNYYEAPKVLAIDPSYATAVDTKNKIFDALGEQQIYYFVNEITNILFCPIIIFFLDICLLSSID